MNTDRPAPLVAHHPSAVPCRHKPRTRLLRRLTVLLMVVALALPTLWASASPAQALSKPKVSKVSPTSGRTAGGDTVTVTGSGFTKTAKVLFGTTPGTNVTVVSSKKLTVVSPAGAAGYVHVRVVTKKGKSAKVTKDRFRYVAPPAITKLSAASGPALGGTRITITGKSFIGVTKVVFGSASGSNLKVTSSTSLAITTPEHVAGSATVTVVTAYGSSNTSSFTFKAASTMTGGQSLIAGDHITSANGGYSLKMQTDCNLVLYKTGGGATWATDTSRSDTACHADMQKDGNLVIYNSVGKAVWSSNTAGFSGASLAMQDDGNLVIYKGRAIWSKDGVLYNQLQAGQNLTSGQGITSANRQYDLIMQGDGNLVVYRTGGIAQWASNTSGSGNWLAMQGDGNLVVYTAANKAVWSSGTASKPGARLVMQDDGNLVIYQGSTAVWDRNSAASPDAKARAQSWVDANVAYSQSTYYTNQYGTYRTDCSGYVSMIWGLGSSYNTSTLPNVSHQIAKDDLRTGDVLLDNTGSDAHVVMFDSWANSDHTYYWAYEQTPPKAVFRKIPYPYWSGYGPYTPYRKN